MKILLLIKKIDKYLLEKRFLLLVLFTPLFWWVVFSPLGAIRAWFTYPNEVCLKIKTLFSEERLTPIKEMRWDSFSDEKNDFSSRLYYNKLTLLGNEIFDYLSYLSPDFHFQAGGGKAFSPQGVEPVPFLLFVFWIFGLVFLIKEKRKLIFKLVLTFSLIAFLGNQKNLTFLFPITISYIYISYIGVERILEGRRKYYFYRVFQVYGLFLIARSLWLTLS